MVSSIIKVCPKAEELSVVRVNIPCPVDGCSSILPHSGSLQIHLSKTHRITEDSNGTSSEDAGDQNAVKHYHCPVQKCVYNVSSERHFTSKKLLRQHYMKIHAEKKHKCPKCGHGFGLERDCQRHLLTCGIIFRCKTCDCPFSSVEATMNHCKIKQHQVPEECKNIRSTNKTPSRTPPQTILILQTAPPNTSLSPIIQNQSSQFGTSLRPLLPKPIINSAIFPMPKMIKTTEMTTSNPLLIAPFVKSATAGAVASQSINIQTDHENSKMNLLTLTPSLTSVDAAIPYLHKTNSPQRPKYRRNIAQTDCTFSANLGRKVGKRPSKNPNYSLHKFTSSTGIQTAVSVPPVKKKSHCNMVGTQTVGDYILTTAMTSAQIPIHRISQGSQVYPRGKQRIQKSHSVESSHTQTMEMQSAGWKKRRRASATHQDNCDEITSSENTPNFLLCSPGGVTDNHTQTHVTDSAPAISTQTHMTCLVNSSAAENGSSFSTQQSAETQTTRSVLQHATTTTTTTNVNSLYQIPNTYDQSDDAQPISLSAVNNSNNPNDSKNGSDGTRPLLENNMASTMQTEPDISLIYSSLTNEQVSTSLTNHLTPNAFPSFADDLTEDIENRNCTSLLNADCHVNRNFECENTTMERPISNPSQLPVPDHNLVKVKDVVCETNTVGLPFGNFINPSLNTECSLSSFPNTSCDGNSLNQFQSLEIQKPEEDKMKNSENNCVTNNSLLCSLVDKDPILCSDTSFADIGDSNDVLSYNQMAPFDNNRNFASTGSAHLEITDSSLLTFQKGICSTENNGDSESFLLEPSKPKNDTDNLNGSFFHSLLNKHPDTHSESGQVNASSSMDTESSFSSDPLCLNDTRASSDSCTTKLYPHEKSIGTDPCLGATSASDLYNVSSNVLTNSPERRTLIRTRIDDLMDESRLSLSHDSCTSLMTPSFAPLVADIEVQTLALDTDFEALLNNSEHSRSSSSAIDMYTQTVEDMLDLFGNNTETQTTVDDTFFQGLEFTDIETQTTSGELDCLENCSLITSGTQTTLSNQNLSKDVEFSDMETQTGFNVCDLDTFLTDSHTQTTFDELVDFLSGLNS